MKFKHEVQEEKQIVKKRDHYTAEINGFDVIFDHDKEQGATIHICPIRLTEFPIGIIRLRPDNVSALRRFSEEAGELLHQISREIAALGIEDLRSKYEISMKRLQADWQARQKAESIPNTSQRLHG